MQTSHCQSSGDANLDLLIVAWLRTAKYDTNTVSVWSQRNLQQLKTVCIHKHMGTHRTWAGNDLSTSEAVVLLIHIETLNQESGGPVFSWPISIFIATHLRLTYAGRKWHPYSRYDGGGGCYSTPYTDRAASWWSYWYVWEREKPRPAG